MTEQRRTRVRDRPETSPAGARPRVVEVLALVGAVCAVGGVVVLLAVQGSRPLVGPLDGDLLGSALVAVAVLALSGVALLRAPRG